jgi:hypothetical protein
VTTQADAASSKEQKELLRQLQEQKESPRKALGVAT